MSYPVALFSAVLALLCIAVHDRLAKARLDQQKQLNEAMRDMHTAAAEANEALSVRAHQRARETSRIQAEHAKAVHREYSEQAKRLHDEDEPWKR